MIVLITGHTGGGKSYLAVTFMLKELDKNRKVYSNIKLNVLDSNYFFIEDDELKKQLEDIGNIMSKYTNQEQAKDELRKLPLKDSYLVVDEAHFMGFRNKNDSLNNFLTIHRHMGLDIVLITQTPANIHKAHLDLVHKHFEARPPSRRISQKFAFYRVYEPYGSKDFTNLSVKFEEDIIKLYKSGKKERVLNTSLFKGLFILFVSFLVMFYALYNLLTSNSSNKVDSNITSSKNKIYNLNKDLLKKDNNKIKKNDNFSHLFSSPPPKKKNPYYCSSNEKVIYDICEKTVNYYDYLMLKGSRSKKDYTMIITKEPKKKYLVYYECFSHCVPLGNTNFKKHLKSFDKIDVKK